MICPMNSKSATVLLGVAILVGGEIIFEHSDSRIPHKHIHAEMHTETVATPSTNLSASGAQAAFDNDAFSPAMPLVSWQRRFKFPEHLVSWTAKLAMMGVVIRLQRDQ
jgi:hypothetical protein